jgi:cytochrome c-type biogenesis protein CcmH/NrfG
MVLGQVRMKQRRYEEARDALVEAVRLNPRLPKAHYQLSLAFARLNDRENSQKHLELYRQALKEEEEHLIAIRTEAGLGVSGMKR